MRALKDKANLAFLPTPLHPLDNLSEALGLSKSRLWMKRDDQTGLAGGGNKARKLEYLVADAIANGADTLVTAGAVQSNHARQTAAAAAAHGMAVELVLVDESDESDYQTSGNQLLDVILGATIHTIDASVISPVEFMDGLVEKLTDQGKKPYLIPIGGSNHLGATGYVECAHELLDADTVPDLIVHATGSGGTQAGLVAGLRMDGSPIPVLGFSVGAPESEVVSKVAALAQQTVDFLDSRQCVQASDILVDDRFIGPGYGVVTQEMVEAVELVARTEGILLDPVYTGKAMAGLISGLREGRFDEYQNIVFLHTGGSAGLFAYRSTFQHK